MKMKSLGELIDSERRAKGLTIRELAKKSGLTSSQLVKYLRNTVMHPKSEILSKISGALDLSQDYFQKQMDLENSIMVNDYTLSRMFDEVSKLELTQEDRIAIAAVFNLVKRTHKIEQVRSLLS